MPWATDAEVLESVRVQLGAQALDARWPEIVGDAIAQSRNDIQTALMGKTYTVAQIEGWDFLAAESRALAATVAFLLGGALSGYDLSELQARYEMLLRRLDALPALSVNGVMVFPAAADVAGGGLAVNGGRMDQSGWRVNDDTRF